MARKTLGFVPLIWQCPFCETQNPGPIKTCTSCGAPQPPDVAFMQVEEDQFNFIKDEALIRMAKAGPDIHCPYCGTRNPATAKTCSNCGGDLSLGGTARKAGQPVPTTAAPKPVPPPAPPMQTRKAPKSTWVVIGIVLLAVIACLTAIYFLFLKTDAIEATVVDTEWERSIALEAFVPVSDADWIDLIPAGAEIQNCSQAYRYTSDEPVANATEVCEVTVEDTGTGVGEVVETCEYEVYDDYCQYTILQWDVIDVVSLTGRDQDPTWPTLNLTGDEREGERSETYTITFSGSGDTYTYTTTDETLFLRAYPGSRWSLKVNSIGGVQSLEPAN